MTRKFSLAALRTLALFTQHLNSPLQEQSRPDQEAILNLVAQLGCIQIDTLQMVQRSQYLVLWSRLGNYEANLLDKLLFQSRKLFEGWQHAASIIPMEEYRFQMPRQRHFRKEYSSITVNETAEEPQEEMQQHVLERIREEGGLRGNDFSYDGPRRSGWWDWKPAKAALESQLACGNLMVADRLNFQRVYDLTERVLPEWVETTEPGSEERDRYWLEHSVKALGVCNPAQAADYTWMKLRQALPQITSMVKECILIEIEGELNNGRNENLLVHRENLALLEKAAEGEIWARRTTFLSPFDSLFWARQRDQKLWGFRQSLEAYLPATKRVYGYFCLPILHNDRLIGRLDPKLIRKEKHLRIKAIYLEPGIEPEDGMIGAVAGCMREFLSFHQATDLSIDKSQPIEFGKKLIASM
jgi:hypothetical protein